MVVCLVLMALLAVVQVAHFHSNPNDASTCALCVAMHSASPVGVTAASIILVQLGFHAPIYRARALIRYWHPQLFTRPPPADL
jgi:hypothetical protein